MGISAIVATVSRTSELRRLLESFAAQSVKDFEVIIVDQNDDGRLEPIVSEFRTRDFELQHVKQTVKNVSAARNCGLRLAKHEIVAFPDDDCWYEPDLIEMVLEACKGTQDTDGVVGRWVELGRPVGYPRMVSWQLLRRFREVDLNSIELFLRRDIVLAIGGFDEALGVSRWFGAGEETDLIMRLVRSGRRLLYSPQIRIHHPWVPVMTGDARQRWSQIRGRARGAGALYAKHALAPSVIARGLVSPLIKCMLPPYRPHHIVAQLATLQGRWEGFLRWRSEHGVGSAEQNTWQA